MLSFQIKDMKSLSHITERNLKLYISLLTLMVNFEMGIIISWSLEEVIMLMSSQI